MPKAVIFDMDGLMFDTEPVWGRCLAPTLKKLGWGISDEEADRLKEMVRGTAGQEFSNAVHKVCGPDVDAEKLWDVWHRVVAEEFYKGVEKKPGLDELLDYLAEHDIPCAVASSSTAEQIAHNLETSGITSKFKVVLSSLEVEHAKPEPDVFLEAARRLGVAPEEAIVLEDSYNGVRAGAAGGFITIMVPDLSAPTDEMREKASRICASLTDVCDLLAAGEIV